MPPTSPSQITTLRLLRRPPPPLDRPTTASSKPARAQPIAIRTHSWVALASNHLTQNKDKALPVTPMDRSVSDTSPQLGYSNYSGDASQQLGRKTSLMKKVGRVVRGGR